MPRWGNLSCLISDLSGCLESLLREPMQQVSIRSLCDAHGSGGTNFKKPLQHAIDVLKRTQHTGPQQLILLTDGGASRPRKQLAELKARFPKVERHMVGIGNRCDINENLLREMASMGRDEQPLYHFVGDGIDGLIATFQRMAHFLRG